MNSSEFKLPAPPWPEHTATIDRMAAHTVQRLHAIRTRKDIGKFTNPYGRVGRLTPAQRDEIAAIGYGEPAIQIAERYGVTDRTVQNIRKKYGLASSRRWGNQHTREEAGDGKS